MGVLGFRYNVNGADCLLLAVEVSFPLLGELYHALAESVDGVVSTKSGIGASPELGTTLADDNSARTSSLAGIELHVDWRICP